MQRLRATTRRVILFIVVLAGVSLSVAAGAASLEIEDGVVVKFGSNTSLAVRDDLLTGDRVVLTSLDDDSIAGQTKPTVGNPAPGDWQGLRVHRSVSDAQLGIDRLSIRYAGGSQRGALELSKTHYALNFLQITESIIGVKVTDGALPTFLGFTLTGNAVALETDRRARPSIMNSDLSNNDDYGVLNRTVANPAVTVQALGNWWGHETGPAPIGEGSPVSTTAEGFGNVAYGNHLDARPLIDCSVEPANGQYEVVQRELQLRVRCRNAAAVRFSETPTFDPEANFEILGGELIAYQLLSQEGSRYLYAEFAESAVSPNNTVIVRSALQFNYSPNAPVVSIDSPSASTVVTGDLLHIQASAADEGGITHVRFSIRRLPNGTQTVIAQDTQAPYEAIWTLGAATDGNYEISATARSSANIERTTSINVQVQRQAPDTEPPSISNIRLAGVPLVDDATIASGGLLTFNVQDTSGVSSVEVYWDGVPVPGGRNGEIYSAPLLEGITNGEHELKIIATDTVQNTTPDRLLTITVDLPSVLAPPTITAPTNNASFNRPIITVAGQAIPGSSVQLYLDNASIGDPIAVGASGAFSSTLTLEVEGSHSLHATATAQTTSSPSTSIGFSFVASLPSVSINSPVHNAVLEDTESAADDIVEIAVTASDILGIAHVQLYAGPTGNEALGDPITGTSPFLASWNISGLPDGAYAVKAVATNVFGKSGDTTHAVTVMRNQAPPPVVTPYIGEIVSVSPSVSYGGPLPADHIVIQGRAIASSGAPTPELVPNALLALMLKVNGFERRINVTSNDAGAFSFTFKPQPTDTGTYQVGVRHPDQPAVSYGHQFTVDRVTVQHPIVTLRAAYCIPGVTCDSPQMVPVRVTAGSGASGLVIGPAAPAEQPDGSWPDGIEVTETAVPTLLPGQSVTVDVPFLAQPTANNQGAIRLSVKDGARVRAHILIQYTVSDPEPALFMTPRAIRAAVAKGDQVIQTFTIENRGAAPASDVRIALRNQSGGLGAPAWMQLGSTGSIGTLGVGESRTLQLSTAPGPNVSDGEYNFRIRVSAVNASGDVDFPSSIAVRESGEGAIRFYVKDIYTDPEGVAGTIVPGLEGARIAIEHETLNGWDRAGITDVNGSLLITDLVPGRYTYRVTAGNHEGATGRITIRDGTEPQTADLTFVPVEEVYLPYALVSFEWSVVETYIQDSYDVVLTAIYQTQVPAPVVLIQPASVNLPNMQTGEEFTGTFTITNYGLIRADNVVFTPPANDQYFDYEFLGTLPSQLEAGQRITMPFRVIAKDPLPDLGAIANAGTFKLLDIVASPFAKAGGSCGSYAAGPRIDYGFQCINGDQQSGSASSRYSKMYGSSCGTRSPHHVGGGGAGGPWGAGGWGGPLGGIPMAPGCTPLCKSCECVGPGGGG